MKPTALALVLALVLPAASAQAAPPGESEQTYRALEADTGLDLSREWAAYSKQQQSTSFPAYLDRRFNRQRNIGRGLVVASATLAILATYCFFFGFTDRGTSTKEYAIAGTSIGLAGALAIPGAVLWGVNFRKLERLEGTIEKLQLGPEYASQKRGLRLGSRGLYLAF